MRILVVEDEHKITNSKTRIRAENYAAFCYNLIMKKRWFKKLGFIYFPNNLKGYLITGFIILFCIAIFLAVDGNSNSVSDTLYGVFPYITFALIVLYLIAQKTSKKRK